jgi:hypothetical protein
VEIHNTFVVFNFFQHNQNICIAMKKLLVCLFLLAGVAQAQNEKYTQAMTAALMELRSQSENPNPSLCRTKRMVATLSRGVLLQQSGFYDSKYGR